MQKFIYLHYQMFIIEVVVDIANYINQMYYIIPLDLITIII